MELMNTTHILETMKSFYQENYRQAFNEYLAELDFTTILSYYSGNCALIVEIRPTLEAQTQTNICIMIECREDQLNRLDDEVLERILGQQILDKHRYLFQLNKVLCCKKINKAVIIKNTSFNEPVLSIKLDKETIYLDLNYKKLHELHTEDYDLIHLLEGIGENIKTLQKI